jgi:glycosyltransferase involved in cell wall biosynthesis
LDNQDISNLLELAGYEVITQQKRMLVPVDFPYITDVLNKWAAPLPIINSLCLTTWVIARIKPEKRTDYSVSIIVPARNEEGNIRNIVKSIPKFGKWQEVVFVEGHSKDRTWEEIKKLGDKRGRISVRAFKQSGIGKADAVRLGFSKARGELLIILDADLTVDPGDLIKFYEVISSNQGEFANGSRLIYPMEKQAMQTLNKFGNTIFSRLFTWILGQRFKDTLCGTKAILKIYYQKIVKYRNYFGDFDPFGDYDLIFGAVKQNLKVVEIPIRYRERVYGKTNISRFTHGWLLLKMTWFAFGKFKTW